MYLFGIFEHELGYFDCSFAGDGTQGSGSGFQPAVLLVWFGRDFSVHVYFAHADFRFRYWDRAVFQIVGFNVFVLAAGKRLGGFVVHGCTVLFLHYLGVFWGVAV